MNNQNHLQMDYLMTPHSLIFLFTTFALFIYALRKWDTFRSPSMSGRLPPSPTPFPFIGHLISSQTCPTTPSPNSLADSAPYSTSDSAEFPRSIVSSAPLARLVLKTHDHVFANRPQPVVAQYLSFDCSDVTFSTYGPYWRQVRKICVSELLSSKRVDSFRLVRDEEMKRMLSAVSTQSGSELDLRKLFSTLTNDVLCPVAFGRRFAAVEEEGPIGKLVRAFEDAQALYAGFSVGDYYPEWKWVNRVSGLTRKLEKGKEELGEACDEIIQEHLMKNDNIKCGEDFVDLLLRVQRRGGLDIPITDDNLKALMLVLHYLFIFN